MNGSEQHAMAAELQAALSRSTLAREPWSQALLLLLETVDQQSNQIRKLEDIVAADAFAADYIQPGVQHTPASLAVSLAHGLQSTKQQVEQLRESCALLSKQQERTANASKQTSAQLQQQLQQLERQQQLVQQHVGISSRLGTLRSSSPIGVRSSSSSPVVPALNPASAGLRQSAAGLGASDGSVAARLQQLEHQVRSLSENAAEIQERAQAAASAVRVLDDKVARQLSNIRNDTKQAITVATAVASKSLKAELQLDIEGKARETERRLRLELEGMSKHLESGLSSTHAAITSACTADSSARLDAAHREHEQQLQVLQKQLDRLSEDKADMRLLTQYTQQVNEVFEQLSVTLVDSTQASIAELMTKQQQLNTNVQYLSAGKVDCSALLQLQQQCQQQVEELHCAVAEAQQAADEARAVAAAARRAAEPVSGHGLELADTQGAVSALQSVVTGLASCNSSHSSQLQDHNMHLQHLGSNCDMLQQQLIALTNQIDPAAAAVLAAAVAGNDDVTAVKDSLDSCESGSLGSECNLAAHGAGNAVQDDTGLPAGGHNTLQSLLFEESEASLGPADGMEQQLTGRSMQQHEHQQLQHRRASSSRAQHGRGAVGASTAAEDAAANGLGIMRHLPVTMRLCLLETGLQEVGRGLASKAPSGDLAALTAQVDHLSSRLALLAESLQSMSSSSIKKLEEQARKFLKVTSTLTAAMDDRPTNAHVHRMVQQLEADVKDSIAAAAAAAAGQEAAAPLQQQVQDVWVELESAKRHLAEAQADLSQLKDWKASLGDPLHKLQKQMQQLEQQMQEEHRSLQQQLESSSRTAASDVVRQLEADQAVAGGTAIKQLPQQLTALDTKLTAVVAEIDRLDQQAAATMQVQGQHNNALSALETAITSHISQCTAAADAQHRQQQQMHADLTAALQQCQQSHDECLVALESASRGHAAADSDIAGLVAIIPNKKGTKEAVTDGARATAEALLQEHKQEEEQRWEVWLSEFARAIGQRPTSVQLEQKLAKLQQQLTQTATGVATSLITPAIIQGLAAAMDDGLGEQLKLLELRLDTLEEGVRASVTSGLGFGSQPAAGDAAATSAAVDAATGIAAAGLVYPVAAAQLAESERRILTSEALDQQIQQLEQHILDRLSVYVTREQVQKLLQQQLDDQQCVSRQELDGLSRKKLDIEAFLASVAARSCAVTS